MTQHHVVLVVSCQWAVICLIMLEVFVQEIDCLYCCAITVLLQNILHCLHCGSGS